MSDLISRKALLDTLIPWLSVAEYGCGKYNLLSAIVELIRKAPAVNDWISVEDRLPEQDRAVLAAYTYSFSGDRKFVDIAIIYNEKDWCWYSNDESIDHRTNITHWMPLPSTEELN